MFDDTIDGRLSQWAKHRSDIETSTSPFEDVWNFWKLAPYIQYNKLVDHYYQKGWPSPWEIIVHNKYDDFTKAVMIGTTLKLTNRFKNSIIKIETYIDSDKKSVYNVVNVDDTNIINYNDNGPVLLTEIPANFYLENSIELKKLN